MGGLAKSRRRASLRIAARALRLRERFRQIIGTLSFGQTSDIRHQTSDIRHQTSHPAAPPHVPHPIHHPFKLTAQKLSLSAVEANFQGLPGLRRSHCGSCSLQGSKGLGSVSGQRIRPPSSHYSCTVVTVISTTYASYIHNIIMFVQLHGLHLT